MLKWNPDSEVILPVFAMIAGAALSVLMPVRGIVSVVCVFVMLDMWFSLRIGKRSRYRAKRTSLRVGIMRAVDYMAALVAVNMFQVKFIPFTPLTHLIGTALVVLEIKRINRKVLILHNFDMMATIGDRIRTTRTTLKRGDRSGNSGGDRAS